MVPWMKIWHEARNDAKLRALSDTQFRVWFNLLLFSSEQPIRGTVTYDSDEYLAAEVSGGNVELLHETLRRLETLHCVSSRFICVSSTPENTPLKRFTFVSFERRQQQNGVSNSTERVKKHRKAKRLMESETNETRVKRDETQMEHSPARGRAPEELDLELELDSPPCVPPPTTNGQKSHTHIREGTDLAALREAIEFLGRDLRTEAVGLELGRRHTGPECLAIAGWKWLMAARRLQDPAIPDAKRRSWPYFAKIAANLTEADRDEKSPAKKETAAQRKARELKEGFMRKHAEAQLKEGEAQLGDG